MESYHIEIPYIVPNANQQLRMHYRARERIKQLCMEWLIVAKSKHRHDNLPFPSKLKRFYLTIERHAVSCQDGDNAVASHKPLIDAMKDNKGLGLIMDDGPHQMLTVSVQHVQASRKNQRTIIKLTEATS